TPFRAPPQSGLASRRFPSPLIEPDVQISRIRLSPVASGLRVRQGGATVGQFVEAEPLIEVRVGVLAVPRASPSASSHQPASDAPLRAGPEPSADAPQRPP